MQSIVGLVMVYINKFLIHDFFQHRTHHWIMCGIETLLLGGACATIAFGIGQLLSKMGYSEAV
jgi:hypothetical protein